MMTLEFVYNQLLVHYPQYAGSFVMIAVVAFIVWKAAAFYFQTTEVNKKLPAIETTLGQIHQGFTTLNQLLLEKEVISNSCYSNGNSPRTLNELGAKLYRESGAQSLFESSRDNLIAELEQYTFDSFLDLDRESLNMLLKHMDDPEFTDIQNFAFEHPTFNGNPLTYTDILHIISIKLREAYLIKHPELKKTEV